MTYEHGPDVGIGELLADLRELQSVLASEGHDGQAVLLAAIERLEAADGMLPDGRHLLAPNGPAKSCCKRQKPMTNCACGKPATVVQIDEIPSEPEPKSPRPIDGPLFSESGGSLQFLDGDKVDLETEARWIIGPREAQKAPCPT